MTTYHHGNLRAALLRAGMKVIEKKGIKRLSVREAARRARVSHNAPYRHFPDRQSLLAGIAAEGFARLGEALKTSSGKAMGEAYVRFALEHPEVFRLMFGGTIRMGDHPPLREAADRAYQSLVDRFRAHGSEAEANVAAAAAWSLVHGLSHLLLDGHFQAPQRDAGGAAPFARQVLEAVRYSIGAQRSA